MKFKAQIKAKTLLDWLRVIRAVSDDCVLDTSSRDAVDVRVIDPANAQMVVMRMPAQAWDVLDVEPGRIGVDLEKMIEKVELFDPDESVRITTGDHEVQDTHGVVSGVRTWLYLTSSEATFGLEPLDVGKMRKPPAEPVLDDLPAQFVVRVEWWQRVVKRAGSVSDKVWIGINPGGGVRTWTTADKEDYDAVTDLNYNVLPEVLSGVYVDYMEHDWGWSAEGAVQSLFAIDYLQAIVPVMQGDVLTRLGQDKTIQMSFDLHGAGVRYIQAPRIE